MAKNLELKIKINSFNKVTQLLNNCNAKYNGLLNQRDVYFEWEKGLLKLRIQNGKNQLIKYIREENSSDRFSNYELLDLEGNNVEEYLSDILPVETVVEKKRELYIYKNTRIHLDTVDRLGNFLELETVVVSDEQDVQAEFNETAELLQLDLSNQIRCSYRDIILEKL
ncbi:MAG: class IV adenylate cyclase [Ignavibacteriae bacterium]|nr:CYTH domain-containing protein [Ignavibacteriota bacterium]NOG98374.1 class IV adenylate cyclase [Ignavibacteriota bacterium]